MADGDPIIVKVLKIIIFPKSQLEAILLNNEPMRDFFQLSNVEVGNRRQSACQRCRVDFDDRMVVYIVKHC